MKISLIAAVSTNRVIGQGPHLAWRNKEDMALFKNVTMGHVVVMGRKTWESIPEKFRPLEGRLNIIVSRTLPEGWLGDDHDAIVVRDFHKALIAADEHRKCEHLFVMGGGELYNQTLAYADDLYITEVHANFVEGADTVYFPQYKDTDFIERMRSERVDADGVKFDFCYYAR